MCLIHVEGLCVSLKNFLKHHALPSWLCCPRAPQGTQLETMELALNNNYYFWLHWVFVVVHGLCCSREAFPHCRKRGLLSLRCSLQWILLLQLVGSRARASIVVAHRFSCPVSCGILVPNPGIEPMSPALAGGFLTTEPPGKSWSSHCHIALNVRYSHMRLLLFEFYV